jgi:signal transduction histidine kinase
MSSMLQNFEAKKYLNEKVLRRTAEVVKQKVEIEEKNVVLEDQKEELHSMLESLKLTQSQLVQSEKMASLGQLVAGIAHEINNPVTFISAGVDSLGTNLDEVRQVLEVYHRITPENTKEKLEEIEDLKEQIDYKQAIREINKLIDSIKNGTERTTQIVNGLRTFSRLDEDVLKIADIHEGLDSTLILLRNRYKSRIEISKEYGDIPSLECFPGQLNQVFMNITSNSIDAIEDKGIITISTSKANGFIQINIKDSGSGMPENIKAKIFDPFYTTKEVGEGTGLGLSISHGIIEKHGGSIKVQSEAGKGSEIIINLPLTQKKSTE